MGAAQYLATYGVTFDQARDFIIANVADPAYVLTVAEHAGITNEMLGEIAGGYSGSAVRGWFSAHGLDSRPIDDAPGIPYIARELGGFRDYFGFTYLSGELDRSHISDEVHKVTVSHDYYVAFNPVGYIGVEDNQFTPQELGTASLGTVGAATVEMEGVFYSSLIRLLGRIDADERASIDEFRTAHHDALVARDDATLVALNFLWYDVLKDADLPTAYTPHAAVDAIVAEARHFVEAVAVGGHLPIFEGLLERL